VPSLVGIFHRDDWYLPRRVAVRPS
jgi:hypothetical protein